MQLSAEMHDALARINAALLNGNEDELAQAFDGVDLPKLLSQETIAIVRALSKAPLTMLLCTLAEHNEVEVERARHWLVCYQSIARHQLEPALAHLSRQHVLRLAVEALTLRQPLQMEQLKKIKLKGSYLVWQDAIELLLDHKDWDSAMNLLGRLSRQPAETEIWLQIARCLSRRHRLYVDETGQPQAEVNYGTLAQLYGLCADAARQAKVIPVYRALTQLAASALEIAGEYELALNRLQGLDPKAESLNIQLDVARCQCKAGAYLQSIETLDKALWMFTQKKTKEQEVNTALLESGRMEPAQTRKKFDVNKASRALSDLSRMANAKGTPVFLVSGTLLGYVREGQLLSHDKDIDVGIVGWENQYALCMALQESALFTVSAQFLKGKETLYIPIQHNATGIWIDVFVYHPQGEKWVTGVDFYFGHRQTFAFTPFELQEIKFLGVTMKAPANSELNLTENYGNWRVPDTAYLSHLESPSVMNKGDFSYMITARLTALAACFKREPCRLAKVLNLMELMQDKDGVMPLDVIETLYGRVLADQRQTDPHSFKEFEHA